MELPEKVSALIELFLRSSGLPGENILLARFQSAQGGSGASDQTIDVAGGLQFGEEGWYADPVVVRNAERAVEAEPGLPGHEAEQRQLRVLWAARRGVHLHWRRRARKRRGGSWGSSLPQ